MVLVKKTGAVCNFRFTIGRFFAKMFCRSSLSRLGFSVVLDLGFNMIPHILSST